MRQRGAGIAWRWRVLLGILLLVTVVRRTDAVSLTEKKIATIQLKNSEFQFLDGNGVVIAYNSKSDLTRDETLNLSNNHLTTIPFTFLQNMKNVKTIDLSHNPLGGFANGSLAGLSELRTVIMDHTNLSSLPEDLFRNCSQLRSVWITNSYIYTLPSGLFSNLPSLVDVNFTGNNVTVIKSDTFHKLPMLKSLDLSYNNMSDTVPAELFQASSSWDFLSFLRNNITSAPKGLSSAVVPGILSFARNKWVEVIPSEFENVASVRALDLSGMAIATVHARAFSGMTNLTSLDLSDNVISVMHEFSLVGLDNLVNLSLSDNNLKEVTWREFPPKLQNLRLDLNDIDALPTLPGNASELRTMNLSHNRIWRLDSGSELAPYSTLADLDLSWNMIENFTSGAFDPVNSSLRSLRLDYNEIKSLPARPLPQLLDNGVNVSMDMNWGVGYTADVQDRSICPAGSIFGNLEVPSQPSLRIYGCIQCGSGTYHYHDDKVDECRSCEGVSSRAYSADEGVTRCNFCPYSADLMDHRARCSEFRCNAMCWMALVIALLVPVLIVAGKIFVFAAWKRAASGTLKDQWDEQDARDDWMVQQLIRQARNLAPSANDDASMMIFDLPKDTQDVLLQTLREGFLRRRAHRLHQLDRAETYESTGSAPDANKPDDEQWDHLEWESLKLSRILSRNDQGEVFLGEYNGRQVVSKRVMTTRFTIQQLFDTVRDVEQSLELRHPNLVLHLGTVWSDPEFLCVVSEYVALGDLQALLELEATATTTAAPKITPTLSLDSQSSPDVTQMLLWAPTKLRLMLDVVQALMYTHEAGILHRDLRSRNVLVTGSFRAKLNDFRREVNEKRIATAVHVMDSPGTDLTDTDPFEKAITMPLLAPEILSQHEYQASADIYSCGVLMTEMWWHTHLTFAETQKDGKDIPFILSLRSNATDSDHMSSSRSDICLQQDIRLRHFVRSLRTWMEREHDSRNVIGSPVVGMLMGKVLKLIEDCMQRDPRKRPTASALAVRLEHILGLVTAEVQTEAGKS